MTDLVDAANEIIERDRAAAIASRASVDIDPGSPGECDLCGEWSGRLVTGICVPCRNLQQAQNKRIKTV